MKHLLLLVIFLVYSSNARRSFVEHSIEKPIPLGWRVSGRPAPTTKLPFVMVLKVKDAALERKFWSVSDPKSSDYANFMSLEEIALSFGPSDRDVASVTDYLKNYGAEDLEVSLSRDFISFNAQVAKAEKMFQVQFQQFEHATLPVTIRTLQPYVLPSKLANLVSFVTGVHRFPTTHKLRVKVSNPSDNKRAGFGDITPAVIWSTFNTNGQQGSNKNNLQGVAQFLDQFFDPKDLSDFQTRYKLPAQPAAAVVGPNQPNNPGTEASLDIQYITGTAPLIPTWFWSTGPPEHGGQEDFVRWAQNMNAAATVPYVMSVSYGDDESTIDKSWADRLNLEFQKLAIRGVSILFASGDDGVGCTAACKHQPNWPASSPFVTSVGGFVGTSSNKLIGDGISSGGFSNFYAMPSYQMAAVQGYLKNGPSLPPAGQYNASSRAMPDVSSFSENVIVVQGGFPFGVGGTSCAAPVFSGVISLVNDALLTAGKKTLGFLNPALYQVQAATPSAFIDVTTGKNSNGCCNGFTATKGWDPITGLGAPNYPVLKQALMALQN